MEKATGTISDEPNIITDLAMEMVRDMSDRNKIATTIVNNVESGDISNEDSGLVDALAYSPYHPADSTGSSSVKSPGNLPAEKMLEGERPTGSGTALKRMKSKLATHLGINTVTDAEMSTEMDNFVFRIGKELLTTGNDNYTRGTISNSKIQDFLKTNLSVNVKRGDIRPCVTMKVGDAQQMIDMWGRDVTEYAKGMGGRGEETGRCYLCGLHIVPFGSCPEMEHKYPATTAYTNMHHYRLLQVYKGYVREDKTADSMYTLWKRFVNNNSNLDNLKTLYNNINHDLLYDRDDVDRQYDSIFTNFWNTTMYAENTNPYNLSSAEFGNVRWFFYDFIKAWLMEFAYSHHICNQAKSDLNIWSDEGELANFIENIKKRDKSSSSNYKGKTENRITQGKIKGGIVNRVERTKSMFDHLDEVVKDYAIAYGNISHSVESIPTKQSEVRPAPSVDGETENMKNFKSDARENVYNVSEAMIMLKALYYISKSGNNNSNFTRPLSPEAIAKKNAEKDKSKGSIQDKYEEVLKLEEEIVQLEHKEARQTRIDAIREKEDKAFTILEDMVEIYRTTYGEEPLSECVPKCITEGNTTEQWASSPDRKKHKAGTGGTRRRRPRSKRRRVSKKKKTRKRKARKTVHKRRSK
jgi:hypothetical protein